MKSFFFILETATKNTILIALACAGAGAIISIITCTGLSVSFVSLVISLSKGYLFIALILTAIITIILGMGMPCVAAYVVAISVIGPALFMMGMGVGVLQVHLFIYYFALLAALTPPVCIAAYATASISRANPLLTGYESVKLAIAGFIAPFIFIFNDSLLLKGSFLSIFTTISLAFIMVLLISISIVGFYNKKINLVYRLILLFLCIVVYLIVISL